MVQIDFSLSHLRYYTTFQRFFLSLVLRSKWGSVEFIFGRVSAAVLSSELNLLVFPALRIQSSHRVCFPSVSTEHLNLFYSLWDPVPVVETQQSFFWSGRFPIITHSCLWSPSLSYPCSFLTRNLPTILHLSSNARRLLRPLSHDSCTCTLRRRSCHKKDRTKAFASLSSILRLITFERERLTNRSLWKQSKWLNP